MKDAGPPKTKPEPPKPGPKPKGNRLYICDGRCNCCLGATKEEIQPTMNHCLDLGDETASNCLERCNRMTKDDGDGP